MKKIMFMLGVTAMAVSVNAASMDWAVSAITAFKDHNNAAFTQSGTPASVTGLTAYLIDYSQLDTITDALAKGTALTASSAGILGIDDTVTKYGAAGLTGVPSSNLALDNPYTVAILYADTRGEDAYYLVSSTFSGKYAYDETDPEAVVTKISGTKANVWDSSSSSGWQKAVASGGGSSDIPEPTSGLLLVLGGAMLALRRRR